MTFSASSTEKLDTERSFGNANVTLVGAGLNFAGAKGVFPIRREDKQFDHLNGAELFALVLYSTNAAYPMNAMMRGLLKSQAWQDLYGEYMAPLVAGLRKLQAGAVNHQAVDDAAVKQHQELTGTKRTRFNGKKIAKREAAAQALIPGMASKMIDPTQSPTARLDIKTLYRNMRYEGVDFSQFVVGGTITEAGFMSTSAKKDAYGAGHPVKWTMTNVKNARSLAGISQMTSEFELLLPPGQQFKVVRVERVNNDTGQRQPVAVPLQKFPDGTHKEDGFHWEITLDHTADIGAGDKGEHSNDGESESEA